MSLIGKYPRMLGYTLGSQSLSVDHNKLSTASEFITVCHFVEFSEGNRLVLYFPNLFEDLLNAC